METSNGLVLIFGGFALVIAVIAATAFVVLRSSWHSAERPHDQRTTDGSAAGAAFVGGGNTNVSRNKDDRFDSDDSGDTDGGSGGDGGGSGGSD